MPGKVDCHSDDTGNQQNRDQNGRPAPPAVATAVLRDAVIGGLGLGILQAELAGFLPTGSVLANGLRPSLPFVVLFVLLLVKPSIRRRRPTTDPLSGVDPPPAPPAALVRPPWMTLATRIFAGTVVVVGLALCLWVLNGYWLLQVVAGVCLAVIMLSIVLTTGVGGTISLCQGVFAAIGAFATAQLATQHNVPVLGAMVIGAVIAAVVGAVLGLAVIRLPGIYAALATLAFALFFAGVMVPLTWVSGGNGTLPLIVPRPSAIGPISFDSDRAFLILAVIILALVGVATIAIRQGTTGRFLDAVRGSESAAAAVGISATRQRLIVFTVGAAVAGFGGGLLASFHRQASYSVDFEFFAALVWVVLVVTAGSRLVQSAVTSGITFFLLPALLFKLFTWLNGYWSFVNTSWANGVGLRAVRLRRLHLRQAPRGHHRSADHGQHPEVRRLLRALPTGPVRLRFGRPHGPGHGGCRGLVHPADRTARGHRPTDRRPADAPR